MSAMLVAEGVARIRAAITPCLFTQKSHEENNVAAASSEACSSGPARRLLLMKVRFSLAAAFVGCLLCASRPASAQEVIHALTGTVASVSTTGNSVSIKLDDGSIRTFKEISGSRAASSLEKTLQAKAIPAGGFGKAGERVILFYYGVGDLGTAVAYKNAGAAPSNQMSGVVSEFERKQHLLTVVGSASQKEQISLPEQTVIETPEGVIDGLRFRPDKGDHLEVIWSEANGQPTALFISES